MADDQIAAQNRHFAQIVAQCDNYATAVGNLRSRP
jgi:hypothetical protein